MGTAAEGARGLAGRELLRPGGWLALSDQSGPVRLPPDAGAPGLTHGTLTHGALICELALPLPEPGVVLDLRRENLAFSIFYDHQAGLRVIFRAGSDLLRASLPGPLPSTARVARITFAWSAESGDWSLRHECPGQSGALEVSGLHPQAGVLALSQSDLDALCRGGAGSLRHPGLLWFGVTAGDALPAHAPWLGQRTAIATPTGLRAAGALAPGDMVMTAEGRAVALRSVRRLELPSRGHHAPVLLRAPYFSPRRDILVSADQPVLLHGGEVEYLFDTEEVLVAARHIADGRAALFDARRPVSQTVSLDIGAPDLIAGDGIAFLSARHDGAPVTPPRQMLHSYEAVPLLLLLGRAGGGQLR